MSIAHPRGGVILVFDVPDGTTTVRRLDGTTGAEDWRYDSPGQVPFRCPQCPSPHGIRRDGTILLVEKMSDAKDREITALDLIGLDGATGQVTSRLPLPISKTRTPEHVSGRVPMISPMVLEDDGTAAVAIGTISMDLVLHRMRDGLKLLRISPSGAATWQTNLDHEGEGAWSNGYDPKNLTTNQRGALLVTWFERDPGWSHALATRTRVLEWELDVMITAIDGRGDGYGVTAEGNVVRVDLTTGKPIGATIHVGKGTRVLSGLPEGGVVVRDATGNIRHYDVDGTLLKKLKTPSDGQHPWRLEMIGNNFIEFHSSIVLAFDVED
jgi:outer membrane protein assembly factor BamB